MTGPKATCRAVDFPLIGIVLVASHQSTDFDTEARPLLLGDLREEFEVRLDGRDAWVLGSLVPHW